MEGVDVAHLAVDLRSPFERPQRRTPHPSLPPLLRTARAAGVRRLVCLSSANVLGFSGEDRVSERTRPHSEHAYCRAMAADEAWLRLQFEPDVVVLRPAQAFGSGERLLSHLIPQLMSGRLRLPGGGRARRSFLAGGDLGRAFGAAALRGEPGAAYLLGGFQGSWSELLRSAAEALGARRGPGRASYDLAYLSASLRFLRTRAGQECWPTPFVVDLLSRPQVVADGWSRRELSWQPRITGFLAGLPDLPEWYRATVEVSTAAASSPQERLA
jgi:nucleoside-diphosphate-sugar epimerase